MNSTFLNSNGSSSSLEQVTWEDSDSSEDEDYLPQKEYHKPVFFSNNEEEQQGREKFKRMNKTVWATIDSLNRVNDETPSERVRRVIDSTIDNGFNVVDLSKLGLIEIPKEIKELKYLTTIHNSVVKSTCLQMYLYSNQLQVINPALFELSNLTALSLRDNKLKTLPPEIALLQNLAELSIGNNQLEVLPAEVLLLKKLSNLALNPNPLLIKEKKDKKEVSVPSLVEISIRHILTRMEPLDDVPENIIDKIQSISPLNACQYCRKRFFKPSVNIIHWKDDILGNLQVPFQYRFCSTLCYSKEF